MDRGAENYLRAPADLLDIVGAKLTAMKRQRTKRGLTVREFALGVEGLERFIRREPLRKVHECVFGVLALESEPVDPRL